jgi:thiol-disulfide isomerase/thioredoxin
MLLATEESSMPSLRLALARIAVLAALAATASPARGAAEKGAPLAPPFPSARAADWIGTPASWEGLRGRVVLLDVWTFACGNCRATMPWLKDVRQKYAAKGLSLVGVHTPEMIFERERPKVEAEVKRQGLDYPHLLDNDSAYWKALGAEYWPTMYLVDRCGRLRDRHVGEVHSAEDSGRLVEARIEALLAAPAGACAAAAETRR